MNQASLLPTLLLTLCAVHWTWVDESGQIKTSIGLPIYTEDQVLMVIQQGKNAVPGAEATVECTEVK